jgi:hypothetical protein
MTDWASSATAKSRIRLGVTSETGSSFPCEQCRNGVEVFLTTITMLRDGAGEASASVVSELKRMSKA